MASTAFSAANNLVVDLGDPIVPLVAGEPRILWSSAEIAQGSAYKSLSVNCEFIVFDPDTEVVSPFNFECIFVVEQKQEDNSWVEIGRMGAPLRRVSFGANQRIIISPAPSGQDDGVPSDVAGFGGLPVGRRTRFVDNADGTLRIRLLVRDLNAPEGDNPFVSVTISVHGKRYDV